MTKSEFDAAVTYLKDKKDYSFDDLLLLMQTLRSPFGCPWDREQTHKSIRADLISETYELAEAIDLDDTALLREETGDVLLQAVFHTQISADDGRYGMQDVINELCEKLIVRHPHVFGDVSVSGSGEVLKNWEAIKSKTKGRNTVGDKMKSVPKTLPALMRADSVGRKSKKANFDFTAPEDAAAKVREELEEVLTADGNHASEEIGDLLFSVVNLARTLRVEPEEALTCSTDKFVSRFCELEEQALLTGTPLAQMDACQAEEIWEKIKAKREKNS